MEVKVKICGLRSTEHALVALRQGADFLGFVFAASPRRISPEQAREIIARIAGARAEAGRDVRTVGVFANEDPDVINQIASACALDLVQLSGDEQAEHLASIDRPCIKTVRLRSDDTVVDISGTMERFSTAACEAGKPPIKFLLDTHHPGLYGGTGIAVDWSLAAQVAKLSPVVLAGGLNPENVAEAIRVVRPWCVDVSSGVETGGIKNPAKIAAFIQAARTVPAPGNPVAKEVL